MSVTVLPNTLVFEDVLDERVSVKELNDVHAKLTSGGFHPPIILDFSKVPYANSSGIVVWLRFLSEVKSEFKYVNTPIWLVNQFNMIDGHFVNESFVESFQAPFYAPATRDSEALTLVLGKDLPVLSDYGGFTFPNRIVDGKEFEIDFSPERYLSFISDNFEVFRRKIR